MNKKKIAKISAVVASAVVVLVAGIVGVNAYIRHKNIVETGNILGVEWYNEADPQFTITTVEQLYELAELSDFYSFKGQTIKLGADLVVNEGNAKDWAKTAPEKRWNPITGFAGVFDGQGHTISGLYGKGFERRMALFADTQMSCSLKNLSLVNSYFETTGHRGTASFVSHGGGKFKKLYSDAIIVHKGENVGGIASSIDVQSTLEECWFDGDINITSRDCGGIIDEVLGARVTVKHCLFSGHIYSNYNVGGTRTGGIFGRTDKAATIVLSDSLSSGTIECEKKVYTGAVLGASYNGVQFTIEDTYTSTETYGAIIGESGKKGTFTGTPLQLSASELTGVKAYQWTTLNFDSYWAVVEGGTPILKCFAETVPSLEGVKKVYDTSWYIQGGFDFTLMTREQLYGFFIKSASTDYKDCKVKLGADIVVNEGDASKWAKEAPEMPWFPISSFAGQFDGQGHTISGLYTKTNGSYVGLFGQATAPSIIQNLSLKNSYFEKTGTSNAFMGSIVGDTYGIVQNIYSDAIIISEGNQVGGIVGRLNDNDKTMSNMRIDGEDYSVMSNCWFDGSITMLAGEEENTGACEAGGLVGRVVQGDAIIEHCLNSGTISSNVTGRALMVGGLVGYVLNAGQLQITDCLSVGEIKADYTICVGSVIGRANTAERIITVKDTYATKESYKVGISKNSLKATVKGDVISVDKSWIVGNKGYQFTTLDFDKYWTVVVAPDETPILSQFATKKPSVKGLAKMVDISWYKEDAKEMRLDSVADLYGFAMFASANNFEGKTIKLTADIAVNPVDASVLSAWASGTGAPENGWMTIGSSAKPFAGTFDGQGHTISGVYSVTDEQYNGLFGVTTPTSMIKNLSLMDSYFAFNGKNLTEEGKEAAAYMGSIVGDLRGDMDSVYSNAIVTSTANQAGGLVGRANGAKDANGNLTTSTINNCWFDGQVILTGETARYAGGIAGIAVQGIVEFTNCLNSGSVSNERDNAGQFLGGIVGTEWTSCTVNIDGCLNTGSIKANYVNSIGSIVGRIQKKGSTFNITDTYATKESCVNAAGKATTVGSKAAGVKQNGSAGTISESMLSGYGGYQYTMLDFDKYWAVVANPDKTLILKTFAASTPSLEGKESIQDWYRPDAKTMEIDSVVDLYGLGVLSEATDFAGQTVKLKKSIDLDPSVEWIPIGSTSKPFAGTFDGGMNTITGMYVDNETAYIGMFAVTSPSSMVKNFYLKDSKFIYSGPSTYIDDEGVKKDSSAYIGSIVGDLRGDMDSVYSNAIVTSTANQVGGIVGRANGAKDADGNLTTSTIHNCWFDGQVILTGEKARYAGGIAGIAVQGTIEITNCLNSGSVSNERPDGGQFLGGIVGTEWTACTVNIDGCLNTGSISAKNVNCISSIVGRIQKSGSVFNITDTYATKESCIKENGTPVTVWSKNAEAKQNGSVGTIHKKMLEGYGGYNYTMLDFDEYWAVVVNPDETPVLKTFAKSAPSLKGQDSIRDWYRADAKTMEIDSVVDLYGFGILSETTDFAGQTVKLAQQEQSYNLDPAVEWIPIGSTSKPFAGTFDGGMNTITGMYVDNTTAYIGMFAVTSPTSMVKNFYLEDSTFIYSGASLQYNEEKGKDEEVGAYMGSIVGDLRGDLDTVYSSATVKSVAMQVGGLVGRANGIKVDEKYTTSTINNCWFDGQVLLTGETARYAGGIAGVAVQGTVEFQHCLNSGSVSNERPDGGQFLGGIVGTEWAENTIINIEDCLNSGAITAKNINCIGSVMGRVQKSGSEVTVTNTYAMKGCCTKADGTTDVSVWSVASSATVTNKTVFIAETALLGVEAYKWTNLNFDATTGNWVARTEQIPRLKSFTKKGNEKSVANVYKPNTAWYDDAAKDATDYYIGTPEELLGFEKLYNSGNVFKGKTIHLTADIALNPENAVTDYVNGTSDQEPDNRWTPGGNNTVSTQFAGIFDGQGHTVSGIYTVSDSSYIGLFGVIADGSIVKDLRITDSYFYSSNTGNAMIGSVAGECRGTIDSVYSEAIVKSAGDRVGGLVGMASGPKPTGKTKYGTATINNSWFNGSINLLDGATNSGGIVGLTMQGNVNVTNCLVTGTLNNATSKTDGGLIGYVGFAGAHNMVVNISDNLVALKEEVTNANVGTVIGTIKNNDNGTTVSRSYTIINTYITEESFAGTNIIADNKENDVTAIVGTGLIKAQADIQGTKGYENTLLDFYVNADDTGEWVARSGKVPALKTFVGTVIVEAEVENLESVSQTGWYDDSIYTYYIGTVSAFKAFRDCVNDGKTFSGKTVYLTDDMDLNPGWTAPKTATETVVGSSNWTPIGNASNKFQGTFDGRGHEIKGVYASGSQYVGLFGYASGATLQNFRLTNSYIYASSSRVGSIVGCTSGNLSKIYSDALVVSTSTDCGGLVGYYTGTTSDTISECWFAGTVQGSKQTGGIIGYIPMGTKTIENCLVSGNVKTTHSDRNGQTGGFVGGLKNESDAAKKVTLQVKSSLSVGTVSDGYTGTSSHQSGGVLGYRPEKAIATFDAVYTTYSKGIGTQSGSGTKAIETDITKIANINNIKGDVVYKAVSEGGLDLDYDAWVARTSDIPVPRCFIGTVVDNSAIAEDKTGRVYADVSWLEDNAGTEADPYQLDSAGDLLGFANEVNAGNSFEGKYIELTKDIDYNAGWTATINQETGELSCNVPKNIWTPIGNSTNRFIGIFNGQGHTISGIYVDFEEECAGLFGYLGNAGTGEAKNLQLVNSYITSTQNRVGGLVGVLGGKATNVYVDAYVIGEKADIGGIAGRMQDGNTKVINTCWFAGYVGRYVEDNTAAYVGGIVGITAGGTNTIQNCLNTGTIYHEYKTTNVNQSNATAGIVGGHTSTGTTTINKCLNIGTITTPNHVFSNNAKRSHRGMGPIIGYVNKDGSTVNITNCIWLNVAELDNTDADDKAYGFRYKGTANVSTSKQYDDKNALIEAVKQNKADALVLGFGTSDEWTTLRVQENNQVKEMTPILKDFKAWWVDEHNYSKNILMIGNSFSYYYVEELYGIANEMGIHLNIYNVYKSGCTLEEHWNWLQNDGKNYEFYITNADGRRRALSGNVGLKECLAIADWDIISLQQASTTYIDTVDTAKALSEPYAGDLYGYLRDKFPNARYLWHQTWSSQIGYQHATDANNKVTDRQTQKLRDANAVGLAKYICDQYNVDNVPSGSAWDIARDNVLIGDTLCNRVNASNEDNTDNHHDGNVGGGQYLNACVWFETLTGKSCIGNAYRPDYDLSEEKIAVLQQSAHDAVKAIYGETE